MERRLAAILAADVVGYSRLMGEDEAGTLAAINSRLEDLIKPKIAEFHGRIVKLMGDGALVEFPSVVEAVQCAVEIQKAVAANRHPARGHRPLTYRIGINLGDVIAEADDIFGDGVNVAARLESLAKPGGICLSHNVYDQVRDKLSLDFEDMGEVKMKNIARSIRAYQIRLDTGGAPRAKGASRSAWRYGIAVASVVMVALTSSAAVWLLRSQDISRPPVPMRAERPAIAVLPFENLGGDPDQEYFADGITDDLITDLSRVSGLLVIARNSSFAYKGKTVSLQQVGEQLGVRYVLEGSTRRSDDRVRINAQLVDTTNGLHLWAERFDSDITDVFALQDEVARKIVDALAIQLTDSDRERLSRSAETNPDAYDLLLRGLERLRRFTSEDIQEARRFFARAIALDPGYARAHADTAISHLLDISLGLTDDPDASLGEARSQAQHALALDPAVREVHFALASVHLRYGRHGQALDAARTAISVDPNYADAHAQLAWILAYSGQPDDGVALIHRAMRLNPHHSYFFDAILGQIYFHLRRYDEAADTLERALERNQNFLLARQYLVATYGRMGKIEDAEWEVEELLTLKPEFSIPSERAEAPYRNSDDLEFYLEGLRLAGLPM